MKRCAICAKEVAPRAENPSYPFCSPRCRQVDLGKWLGEEYRVASRDQGAEDEREDELPPIGSDDDPKFH